jgi:protein-tyrosine phosphatase
MSQKKPKLETLSVLVVCTGNICRSPLAEQILQDMTKGSGLDVSVTSAGTFAEVGNPMHPNSARTMLELGYQPKDHVARQLTPALLDNVHLVLSATEEHRSRVAQTNPAAIKKSFTIAEFARVAAFLNSEPESIDGQVIAEAKTPHQKIELAARYRGYAPPAAGSEDIDDPWGSDYAEYQRVARQMQKLLGEISNWWGPA